MTAIEIARLARPASARSVPAGLVPARLVPAGHVSAGRVSAGHVSAGRVSAGRGMFLQEFLRNPLRTASVVPSSRALAEVMAAPLLDRPDGDRPAGDGPLVILELGPGTGAFTEVLAELAPRGTRQLALELNPVMTDHLTQRFPRVEVVTGPASDLPTALKNFGLTGVDLIVSGLPWQAFSGPVGGQLISTIAASLRPGGVYTQFTYSWTRWAPPARRQHAALRENFGQVEVSRTVWRNFPPAFVYTSRLARTVAQTALTGI